MILVAPFTGSSDYFTELSSRFLKFGGLGGHRLLVPSAPETLSEAEAFVAGVRSQFVQADVLRIPSPNAPLIRMFRDGVIAAANVRPGQQEIPRHPVLWLEPGYLPTKADWADALQSAFFNTGGGQRVLAEWRKRPDLVVGVGASQHTVPGGWEPCGPAVFPAGFIVSCELIHRINDLSAPWRERLQFVLAKVMAESPALSDSQDALLAPAWSVSSSEPAKPKRMAAARPIPAPDPEPVEA
jgi:hypothetical protein